MQIRLVISGRGYYAAQDIPTRLNLPDGATVDDALGQLAETLSENRAPSDNCLIAVSGTHLGTIRDHQSRTLQDGDELVILAPVAGG